MTRYRFDGPAAYLIDRYGRPDPNASVQVYADQALTIPVTDLLDRNGAAVSSVVSDAAGYVNFFGPDGVSVLYVSNSSGGWVRFVSADLSAAAGGGGGSARQITGPTLPSLPSGTEYVWNKTDGAGHLLDILSGVA